MHCSDGTGMLIGIAAEVLLVGAILLGGGRAEPSAEADSSLPAETTVTTTVSLPETTLPVTTTTTTTTTATTTTTTVTTTTETTTESTTETTFTTYPTLPRVLSDVELDSSIRVYEFPEDADDLLSDTVFIGDSITLGLKTYGIVPADHVLAHGGIGIRNVLEQEFTVKGKDVGLLEALETLHPQYVSFAFGLNDLHMTSKEKYCENYETVLTAVREVLPHARLIVVPTTPVMAGISFTTNAKVDEYNAALKEYADASPLCHYVDVTPELKNQWNALKSEYQSGDGIHFAPKGYAAYLWQFCTQLHDISLLPPDPAPETTTDTTDTTDTADMTGTAETTAAATTTSKKR